MWQQASTSVDRPYRVNASSFPIPGISASDVKYSVALALDTLTEQGGAAPFRYDGTTSLTQLPTMLADCQAQNIDYNLVVVADGSMTSTAGVYHARCRDPNNGMRGTRFEIFAYVDDNWAVGDASTGWDLVHNWVHEAIHSMNITHPSQTEGALVAQSGALGTFQNNRGRDLYEYDLKCLEEIASFRNLTGTYRAHTNSVFGNANTLNDMDQDATTGSVGVTKNYVNNLGAWNVSSTYRNGSGVWRPTSNCCSKYIEFQPQNTSGWYGAVWRENENMDRVFYSDWRDDVQYSNAAKDRERYLRSSNGFFNTSGSGQLSHCSIMNGFMQCSLTQGVFTGKKIAVAWDTYVNRSQTAWVNQNRLGNSSSREIFIATGHVNEWTLPTPFKTGLQSNVSPGLACGGFLSAGNYDCVLAYVPQDDPLGRVKVRRFYSSQNSTNYTLQFDPNEFSVPFATTANSIALWYHDGKYWLAIRSALIVGQPILIYSSSDGAIWSYKQQGDESDIGPSAVGYQETGTNYLSVWRH